MKQYRNLLLDIFEHGVQKSDRTGTGTRSLFGYQMRFNLQESFPLLTTKSVHWRSLAHELLWFLRGETNIRSLQAAGVSIWDEWADENGDLGPVYGAQWRSWPSVELEHLDSPGGAYKARQNSIDQIEQLINRLETDPDSRRLIVSAWNPAEVDSMALPPCHCLFQFYTAPMTLHERERWAKMHLGETLASSASTELRAQALDQIGAPTRRLSCQLYQRSGDAFLGVPFNIGSYSLLVHMVAHRVGMAVGEFVWTGGDVHLYDNHVEQARLQLSRPLDRPVPTLHLDYPAVTRLEDVKFEDLILKGYDPHPAIKAPVAV